MNEIVTKICSKCKEVKQINEFNKQTQSKDGISRWCKKCKSENFSTWRLLNKDYLKDKILHWKKEHPERVREHSEKGNKKYKEAHPERHNESSRKWAKKNPEKRNILKQNRRAKKEANGGSVTEKEWKEILEKYGNKCLCCGRTDVKITMDHVIPIALGGRHEKENVQPLCQSCNSIKQARTIDYR